MKIVEGFEVARPREAVWALFSDIPAVAACMPGAELSEDKGDGRYAGRVTVRLGPFGAAFEGEAQVTMDAERFQGHIEGRGVDKRGGSRTKLALDYQLTQTPGGARVDMVADVQLSGPIAQFGRTGVIDETARILIGQFARNAEARIVSSPPQTQAGAVSAATAEPKPGISGVQIVLLLIASFFRRLFGRTAA